MGPLSFIERFFNIRAFERESSVDKAKITDLSLKVDSLSLEKEDLRQKVQELEDNHNNPLKFDDQTGTWVDESSGLRYCAKCKSQNITSPLKNGEYGWSCPACNKQYADPSRPHKPSFIPE